MSFCWMQRVEQNRVLLVRTKVCFGSPLATRAHIAETDLLDLPYMSFANYTLFCCFLGGTSDYA